MSDAAQAVMLTADRIRAFVRRNFYVDASLADDASLLESGVVDSTGVMEVIQFVEREFGIHVAEREITPENLDSITRTAAYVERKLAAAERGVRLATTP